MSQKELINTTINFIDAFDKSKYRNTLILKLGKLNNNGFRNFIFKLQDIVLNHSTKQKDLNAIADILSHQHILPKLTQLANIESDINKQQHEYFVYLSNIFHYIESINVKRCKIVENIIETSDITDHILKQHIIDTSYYIGNEHDLLEFFDFTTILGEINTLTNNLNIKPLNVNIPSIAYRNYSSFDISNNILKINVEDIDKAVTTYPEYDDLIKITYYIKIIKAFIRTMYTRISKEVRNESFCSLGYIFKQSPVMIKALLNNGLLSNSIESFYIVTSKYRLLDTDRCFMYYSMFNIEFNEDYSVPNFAYKDNSKIIPYEVMASIHEDDIRGIVQYQARTNIPIDKMTGFAVENINCFKGVINYICYCGSISIIKGLNININQRYLRDDILHSGNAELIHEIENDKIFKSKNINYMYKCYNFHVAKYFENTLHDNNFIKLTERKIQRHKKLIKKCNNKINEFIKQIKRLKGVIIHYYELIGNKYCTLSINQINDLIQKVQNKIDDYQEQINESKEQINESEEQIKYFNNLIDSVN